MAILKDAWNGCVRGLLDLTVGYSSRNVENLLVTKHQHLWVFLVACPLGPVRFLREQRLVSSLGAVHLVAASLGIIRAGRRVMPGVHYSDGY